MKVPFCVRCLPVVLIAVLVGAAPQPLRQSVDSSSRIHNVSNLLRTRAELRSLAFQEPLLARGDPGALKTNTGEVRVVTFRRHDLAGGFAEGGGAKILYAPAEADDPAFRASIAAAGGATVDYFDARASTPSLATLSQYDAVYTWVNFPYADNVLFGNNLAQYNDAGGTVVLGPFCTYTSGNSLSGQIMTASYSPVTSPSGTNHFASSTYAGDGGTCIYAGVGSLECIFRDVLVTQGPGIVDGTYLDGEICHAYRPACAPGQGNVVYSNGSSANPLGGSGGWPMAVWNGASCAIDPCNPMPPAPLIGRPSSGNPGPPCVDDVYERRLSLGRVWFRNPGDAVGKGDVTVDAVVQAVGALFDEVQATHLPKGKDVYKVKRAKSKCADTTCAGSNEKCNWFDVGGAIYKSEAVGQDFCPLEVGIQFTDLDQSFASVAKKWVAALVDVAKCYTCIAAPGPWVPACIASCGTALLSVAAAIDVVVNKTYDGKPDKIGRINGLIVNSPAWTVNPTQTCASYALTQTLNGKEARAELNWYVENLMHQGAGCLPCWPTPPAPDGTATTLSGFQFMQVSGDELNLSAYVAGGSLSQPEGLLGTREIKFFLNADNDQGTGSPVGIECGADYYVSVLQASDGSSMSTTAAIYCWDPACCTGTPGWNLVADQEPYELRVLSRAVRMKVRLSAVGQPLGYFSSWVAAELDGVVETTVPASPCSSPPEIAWSADTICPYVESVDLSALADGDLGAPIRFGFNEPVLVNVSDVILSPPTPFSLSVSHSGTVLEIQPVSAFAPGGLRVTLAGTITDTSGNALRTDPLRDPLAFCGQGDELEICLTDPDFRPTDAAGVGQELYTVNEAIHVSGDGFAGAFHAYLVFHDSLAEGAALIDQSDTGPTVIAGGSFTAALGKALVPQEYAVVADLNLDGVYQLTDRVAGACGTSLVVGDPCDVSVEDLTLLWPLDEQVASARTAELLAARNGVLLGVPSVIAGRVGNALEFAQSGGPQAVEVPPAPELVVEAAGGGEGDFSIDLWLRTTTSIGQQGLAGTLDAGGSGAVGYGVYLEDGEIRARLGDGTNDVIFASGSFVADGAWHHVAWVVDRDQPMGTGFFIDGMPTLGMDATAVGGALDAGGPFRIATSPLHGGFDGAIDEVALTARALSTIDVASLVTLPAGGKCAGSCPGSSHGYGCDLNPPCSLSILSGDGSVAETTVFGIDNPVGTQTPGAFTVLLIALQPQPGFPCGLALPGFGMSGPGTSGELLVEFPAPIVLAGPVWPGPGTPAPIGVLVPSTPTFVGTEVFLQGAVIDLSPTPSIPIALTNALKIDLKE